MCTGTGEMAVYLHRLAGNETRVQAVDFSLPMMLEAKKKPESRFIDFVASNIRSLPFASGSFDLITMSFATRNINLNKDILIQSFVEFYRILKPAGRFVNLETSQPPFSPVRRCFHLYVKLFVQLIGSWISGSGKAYAYLAKTIPRFYSAEELAEILRQAGFAEVEFHRLLFGAAAIHHGVKR